MAKIEQKVKRLPGALQYVKVEPLLLKNHYSLNERWLQEIISQEPSILGLGELQVIQRERRQPSGGRLDLLLLDPELNRRYEVELQLGLTDESHLIRCIEYWDIERKRYPAYEHFAVLIAENVTSRFLNVISLFSGSIPLIVLQLSATQLDNQVFLNFVRVIDQTTLRNDDETEDEADPKDRNYWISRTSEVSVGIADECLTIINEFTKAPRRLNYNKFFIGLHDGIKSGNFMYFRPRRNFTHVHARLSDRTLWLSRLEEADLEAAADRDPKKLFFTLRSQEIAKHQELIRELIKTVVSENE